MYFENILYFIILLLYYWFIRRIRFLWFRCGFKLFFFIILLSILEEFFNYLVGKLKCLGVVGSFFMFEGLGVVIIIFFVWFFVKCLSIFFFFLVVKMLDSRFSWFFKCFGDCYYWDINFLFFVLVMEYGIFYFFKRVWVLMVC